MNAEDYFAIQNLVHEYFDLVDTGRFEDCARLFAEADMVYPDSGLVISRSPEKLAELMQ